MFIKGHAALILICAQTRHGLAVPVPVPVKNLEECEFVLDCEPATVSLSRLASEIRQQLGYK